MQIFGILQTGLIEILTRAGTLVSEVLKTIQGTDAIAGADTFLNGIVDALTKSIS